MKKTCSDRSRHLRYKICHLQLISDRTDPGAAPPFQPRSVSLVKSVSTSSSSLGVRDRVAFLEERATSPAPARARLSGRCPNGIYGLGIGLGFSPPGLGLTLARSPARMLSTPFYPAQSMSLMSPTAPMDIRYHLSMSSLSQSRPVSPFKSTKSHQSSEGFLASLISLTHFIDVNF